MTIDDLRALLTMVTYKPGYRFAAEAWYECVHISVHTPNMPDSTGRESHVSVMNGRQITLTENTDAASVLRLLREMVKELELHECDEWLKFGGKLLRDPHMNTNTCDLALDGKLS